MQMDAWDLRLLAPVIERINQGGKRASDVHVPQCPNDLRATVQAPVPADQSRPAKSRIPRITAQA
jgi:hypothetical protein